MMRLSHTVGALNNWVKAGLGFRVSAAGERLFDPVEVTNHMKWMGLTGRDGFWSEDFVRTGRMFTKDLTGSDDTGAMRGALAPARFCMTLRRSFDLSRVPNRAKARLRIPVPLANSARNIDVKPIASGQHAARISITNGRIEFQVDATEDPFVTVAAEVSFTATGYSNDDEKEQMDPVAEGLIVRPSEGLIKVTPRILALAQSFGGKDKSWDVVMDCWNYALTN